MDDTSISFTLLPPETKELIFQHAMSIDPYNAWQLACVCKNWSQHINNLLVTTHIISTNPEIYAYSSVTKLNPKSCLQTAGLAKYIGITAMFAKTMEDQQVTEEDLNNLFCSKKRPYRYIICNKNDYFPLQCACREANLVGVNFLLKNDVIPSIKNFHLILGVINNKSNHKKAEQHMQVFKLLCHKNQIIARSNELLFEVHYNLSKKTERYYHLLKTLVEAGTNLNHRDEDDDTVLSLLYYLHEKAQNKERYKKIATFCMEHGANPHIKPKNNKCVYELAKQNEDQSFFALITEHYKPTAKKD